MTHCVRNKEVLQRVNKEIILHRIQRIEDDWIGHLNVVAKTNKRK